MLEITIPTGSTGLEPVLLTFTQVRALLNVGAAKLRELVRDGGGRSPSATAASP